MNEYLRRALRRNVRLASRLAAPVMLTLGLTMFGLSQIGPASTLWSETLTIGGSATTGAFACKPLQVTGGTVTTITFDFVDKDHGYGFNDAVITGRGIQASNGIIHVIDTVLLPPDLAIAGAPAPEAAPSCRDRLPGSSPQ